MFSDKVILISDPLHGSIQISELEKNIISTQVFNRLHHVLQNSTVYLTFPSNKTSRFIHSIGVMHLGGEMFRNAVLNACYENGLVETVVPFLEHAKSYLRDLKEDDYFQTDIKPFCKAMHHYDKIFDSLIDTPVDDPFYISKIPTHLEEYQYTYTVLYQALRCTALLHDVGHPPFSHIVESALDTLYETIRSKDASTLSDREKNYNKIVGNYKASGEDLHERLSKQLSERIFDSVVKDIVMEDDGLTIAKKVFYTHVKHVTMAILNDLDNVFKSIHSIVDGVIDCDRLDYVSRDPLASGLNDGIIEYERLVKTIRLIRNDENYIFALGARSINTIEDFFQRRWRLYTQVIWHHRVFKTDALLYEVVVKLAEEYLEKTDKDDDLTDYRIPGDISGLWRTFDKKQNLTDDDWINHLIQWDDAWLLGCLRNAYFLRMTPNPDPGDYLMMRLEELLSNKKKYTSLYKRLDGLADLDRAIGKALNRGIFKEAFDKQVGGTLAPLEDDDAEAVSRYCEVISKYSVEEDQRDTPVLNVLINNIYSVFELVDRTKDFNDIITSALKEVCKEGHILDYIYRPVKRKTGLEKQTQIYSGTNLFSLDEFSRINVELEDNKSVFPPFFIYFYGESSDFAFLREKIGNAIARELEEYVSREVKKA